MKAGILTCHDVFNPGSSLQALALSHYLAEQNVDAEIIDYKPDYMYRLIDFMKVDSVKWQKSFFHRWAYRIRLLPYRLSLLPKYFRYRTFNWKYLSLTNRQYHTINDLQSICNYDILICGSDQIWASVKNQCGEDPAFYLNFAPNAKKIAYAASFGTACISETGAQCLKEYLPHFHAISVRESTGVEILNNHGFQGQLVLDPVFLKDKIFWESLCIAPNVAPNNYVFVYGYDSCIDLDELGATYASQKGLQIISLKPGSKYSLCGPENFLWLIKNANMVITSSFHATAFSIIFETPFTVVPTGNLELFERILSILELTGLQGRQWKKDCDIDLLLPADYDHCREVLTAAKETSKSFLLGALYGSDNK